MLSIAGLRQAGNKDANGKGPIDYYKDVGLSMVSYHDQDKDCPRVDMSPVWSGKGAATLGLTGEVCKDFSDVEMLAQGFGPKGEDLVRGAGDRHRVGHDFMFQADDNLSRKFAVGNQATQRDILDDIKAVTDDVVEYLERHAVTRRGEDGQIHEPVKGLACAQFQHYEIRDGHPTLHVHVLVFNVAERLDGTFGTPEPEPLYAAKQDVESLWGALAARVEKRELSALLERSTRSATAERLPHRVGGRSL